MSVCRFGSTFAQSGGPVSPSLLRSHSTTAKALFAIAFAVVLAVAIALIATVYR
jgi:hypothetical protein